MPDPIPPPPEPRNLSVDTTKIIEILDVVNDLSDKVDDCINRLNDIKEKLDEI